MFLQGLVSEMFQKDVRRCHAKNRDCCEILQRWDFDDAVKGAGLALLLTIKADMPTTIWITVSKRLHVHIGKTPVNLVFPPEATVSAVRYMILGDYLQTTYHTAGFPL